MKALVYRGPGVKSWEDFPDPILLADTDAIVRVERPRSVALTFTS
jgi:alcohol dehydrogenase